ncbi:glycosyltransferase family 2 protein [Thauera aromatica]|uniref:glycosyltransferase family 2 protein n=1 Tax=Thauera aromatica TaxID=59405 RepID=UPI001FFD4E6C|nr:glycosyltransferase family 2 protein [Thauera aromatica]MCK2086919.1 glycosyltransferase family 2 protein [Thauera aromatica]
MKSSKTMTDEIIQTHSSGSSIDEAVTLSIVVPVFNEAEAVGYFLERLKQVFEKGARINLDIVFVNDGSTDNTLSRLLELQRDNTTIRIVDLSRNFGKEAALTAGLKAAKGHVIVPIDVDLQDPPELIPKMIEKWREGFDVVLGKRINRDSDSWSKQKSSTWFYRLHNKISDLQLPENVGDFRLMDRAVVDALGELTESRRFMKGLFAWVGFRTATIEYTRPKRSAGRSKFNGWSLWNFALEGITSFSNAPLRIWTYLGSAVAFTSFIFALFIMLRVLVYGTDVPGYASIIVSITFLGGIQLIGIGIIGEYLGRTYIESKHRPVYLVRRIYEIKD